jgi:hypothetical protein
MTRRFKTVKHNGSTFLVEAATGKVIKRLGVSFAAGAVTDRELFRGHGTLGDQFDGADDQLDEVTKRAIARGYRPNVNDVYMPTLADDVGDPKAFVPASEGRHHIKKVCEERNWECDGIVKAEMDLSRPSHTNNS